MLPGFKLSMAISAITIGNSEMDPISIQEDQFKILQGIYLVTFLYLIELISKDNSFPIAIIAIQLALKQSLFCSLDLLICHYLRSDFFNYNHALLFALISAIIFLEKDMIEEAQIYLSEEISFWKKNFFISKSTQVALFGFCNITLENETISIKEIDQLRSLLSLKSPCTTTSTCSISTSIFEKENDFFCFFNYWLGLLLTIFTGEYKPNGTNSQKSEPIPILIHTKQEEFFTSNNNFYDNHKHIKLNTFFSSSQQDYHHYKKVIDKLSNQRNSKDPLCVEFLNEKGDILKNIQKSSFMSIIEIISLVMNDNNNLTTSTYSEPKKESDERYLFTITTNNDPNITSNIFNLTSPRNNDLDLAIRSAIYLVSIGSNYSLTQLEKQLLSVYFLEETKRVRRMVLFIEQEMDFFSGQNEILLYRIMIDFFNLSLKLGIVKRNDSPLKNRFAIRMFYQLKNAHPELFSNNNNPDMDEIKSDLNTVFGSKTETSLEIGTILDTLKIIYTTKLIN